MMKKSIFAKIIFLSVLSVTLFLVACSKEDDGAATAASSSGSSCSTATTTCNSTNDLTNIPSAYLTALTKYTTVNSTYLVNVCTEDTNADGLMIQQPCSLQFRQH